MAIHFDNIEAAWEVYNEIRDGRISNKATAYGMLQQIINDFPNSELASLAKSLRDSL